MLSATRTIAALTLAAGGVLVVPATASATPSNCTITRPTSNGVAAKCTTGTGVYRVVANCLTVTPSQIIEFTTEGPWVGIGKISKVACGNRPPSAAVEFG